MITLFKKKSYKRTVLGLFIVSIFISVALTNAKAEDANPATVLNEEVTSDKQDWLWFNDYERSSDLGLVYDPDIKVEDKGYSFEIESVLVDSSRLVISAKHNGPDGRFLQSPLEDTEIRVTDLKGNVVATEGVSVGNTYPGVQEYVFLFDELPPDQVVVQAKPQYIWADKEDQIKREKIEVDWDFEFTLDMIKTKQLDKRDLLNEKYITSAGFEMGIGQFIRTPNGMRIDMNLSLNDELGKMAVQNWGDYMNIWYHLETDDQKESNKYFGQKDGSYATKIQLQDVVEANGNVSWSNTWFTSTVSPELKNIRFVVDEYSLPINKEAAVEIDLSKLAKTPVVFEDEGDTITIEEHQFEKESSTGKTSLRFSGKGTYRNQATRDEWIALDDNGKTYTVRTEGSGSSTADGGSVWDDLDFVITDVPDSISQLTLKRVIVDKKFTDVDWSVDLPSYSSLPWLSK